jgi:hypothetical protein
MAVSRLTSGNSTISNQLEAGSIMVSAMKSIAEPSLPLRYMGRLSQHTVPPMGCLSQSLMAGGHILVYVFY